MHFISRLLLILSLGLAFTRLAMAQDMRLNVATTAEEESNTLERPAALIFAPTKTLHEQRLLIIFPGMYKSPSEYENLAHELQVSSPYALWVGIIKFAANFDNPPQAASAVNFIFNHVRANGFPDAVPELTTIAGHSLGGIIAQYYVNKKDFAGLILMSSYLVRSDGASSLPQASLPVFTLSGELDGQTRVTRVAMDAKSLIALQLDLNKKAVVVIPKVNHSQFAGTERAKSDLRPEIDYHEAQKQIAQLMIDFMVVNDAYLLDEANKRSATERLHSAVQLTRERLTPYWEAQEKDKNWCNEVQRDEAASLSVFHSIDVNHVVYKNDFAFAKSKPQAFLNQFGDLQLNIGSKISYHPNIIDRSTIPEAAQTIACKYKNAEALGQLTGHQMMSSRGCREHNEKIYQWALSKLSAEARELYLRRGRKLQFAPDREVNSGLQWVPARLSFENDPLERMAVVTSTRLSTGVNAPFGLGGMKYCKLLSPSRAMEWMMVDGLRD